MSTTLPREEYNARWGAEKKIRWFIGAHPNAVRWTVYDHVKGDFIDGFCPTLGGVRVLPQDSNDTPYPTKQAARMAAHQFKRECVRADNARRARKG